MPEVDGTRDWGEYRRLILSELERISRELILIADKLERFRQEDLAQIKTDLALLKFQAALYGSIAGVVITVLVSVVPRFLGVK
jgi:GTPase Era involved in 16S rRNA processing